MQDFVPNGTGNSRYLKSISDFLAQYPTYEDMVAALVAGTLPVDFNGVNSAGYTQLGTALSKANLLTDATAAAIAAIEGATTPATPNEALNALAAVLVSRVRIQAGTYVGTGTYGRSNPNTLTFDFTPKVFAIYGYSITNLSTASFTQFTGLLPFGSLTRFTFPSASNTSIFTFSGSTVSWYCTAGAAQQANDSGRTYYYVAIG